MGDPQNSFWLVLMDPTDFTAVAHLFEVTQVKRGSSARCAKAMSDVDGRAYQSFDDAVASSRRTGVQRCPDCEAIAGVR
jgi:hypothetical protein